MFMAMISSVRLGESLLAVTSLAGVSRRGTPEPLKIGSARTQTPRRQMNVRSQRDVDEAEQSRRDGGIEGGLKVEGIGKSR